MLQRPNPFEGLPRGHYGAICVDPPTTFKARTAVRSTNWTSRRDIERHYQCMEAEALMALPIGELAARDSHLFLWATGPNLPLAFTLIASWGFRYSSIGFAWVKLRRGFVENQIRILPFAESDLHVGLGLTTRHNVELCLLARRGNARRLAKDVREIILAPVREHSRKPDEAYRRIQRYCAGPYLELFARERRLGWDSWGDEVGKFAPLIAEAAE
jgi:N6-adenosine-specific RNA methylase IME4